MYLSNFFHLLLSCCLLLLFDSELQKDNSASCQKKIIHLTITLLFSQPTFLSLSPWPICACDICTQKYAYDKFLNYLPNFDVNKNASLLSTLPSMYCCKQINELLFSHNMRECRYLNFLATSEAWKMSRDSMTTNYASIRRQGVKKGKIAHESIRLAGMQAQNCWLYYTRCDNDTLYAYYIWRKWTKDGGGVPEMLLKKLKQWQQKICVPFFFFFFSSRNSASKPVCT